MFHPLTKELLQSCELPTHFNNPFDYRPHPLVVGATEALRGYLKSHTEWNEEISRGKMFGVLIVRNTAGEIGFLTAFSGNLANQTTIEGFVPPIFDLKASDSFFTCEESEITSINNEIKRLESDPELSKLTQEIKALKEQSKSQIESFRTKIKQDRALRKTERQDGCSSERQAQLNRESQHQKAELKRLESKLSIDIDQLDESISIYSAKINQLKESRRQLSIKLQRKIFNHYNILNHKGESITLTELFEQKFSTLPPAGAGECAAPKLLHYAFRHNYEIIAMGEFWQGASPKGEVRHHNSYYPACNSKCKPILGYMLDGVKFAHDTLAPSVTRPIRIIYEDQWLAIIDKPSGLLSVKGTSDLPSVEEMLPQIFPLQPHSKVAHRLDMDTSGLLVVAFTPEIYTELQSQFADRTIKKRYVALLDGVIHNNVGEINLPLSPDFEDLPRQKIDHAQGKESITKYEVITKTYSSTRINLYPLTGRTHQLRLHCSHAEGLNTPIIGDRLYGKKPSERLFLHAEEITLRHPVTNKEIRVKSKAEF